MMALTGQATACSESRVQIRGDFGQAQFTVELALTPQEQQIGLMNRPSMPMSRGMLFVYPAPAPKSFWMANTLIPLDMLFIDNQGIITHIHENAIPLDRTLIPGGDAVKAVLEINGGLSRRMGITAGSQIRHPRMPQPMAIWPCE